jgi:hypothetical protein
VLCLGSCEKVSGAQNMGDVSHPLVILGQNRRQILPFNFSNSVITSPKKSPQVGSQSIASQIKVACGQFKSRV